MKERRLSRSELLKLVTRILSAEGAETQANADVELFIAKMDGLVKKVL